MPALAPRLALALAFAPLTVAQPLVIENVHLVTMTSDGITDDGAVVVDGDRLTYAGPRSALPALPDARRIDGRGGYLLPGLTDMHVHIGHGVADPGSSNADVRTELLLYVAHGVTTVRNMAGEPWTLDLRRDVAERKLLGPRIVTAGPVLEARPSNPALKPPRVSLVRTPEEARTEVLRQKSAGYDFIKVYNDIDLPTYEAILTTAHDAGLAVAGHVAVGAQLEGALRLRQDSIEHFRGYDLALSPAPTSLDPLTRFAGWPGATEERLRAFARETAAAGIWNTPTLIVQSAAPEVATPELFPFPRALLPAHLRQPLEHPAITTMLPEATVRMIQQGAPMQRRLVHEMALAGAPLMIGTDAPIPPFLPGAGTIEEVRLFVESGLTPLQALQAATREPARYLRSRAPSEVPSGVIEAGARADLILVNQNPLQDVANLRELDGVLLAGQWLSRQDLHALIDADISARRAASALAPPPPKYEIRVEVSKAVPMRDGTLLSTDLYFPVGADTAKLPALLIRTPYDKGGPMLRSPFDVARFFAGQGYVVAIQDIRGTFASGGRFQLAARDVEDGDDTITWIAKQPWSSGKVGMYGCSLLGATQVKAAQSLNPALKAILPQHTATAQAGSNVFWKGGALELGASLPWYQAFGPRQRSTVTPPPTPTDWPAVMRTLPLIDMDRAAPLPWTDWRDHLTHAPGDPWWDQFDFIGPGSRIDVPALFVTSWYDHGVGQTMSQFEHFRRHGVSARTRENQFAIISPATHCGSEALSTADTIIGERNLGDARFDFFGTYLKWFDYWLRDSGESLSALPRVQYFLMGRNEWKSAADWPVPGTRFTPYYLRSEGRANSRAGDGALSVLAPGNEPADSYLYDPEAPVPSGAPITVNAMDQRAIEMRGDVLVYATPPLESGVEVTGPVKLVLYVSSSAPDTDFTAKLVDVYPDGRAILLQEGILRARYREGLGRELRMKPGEVYEIGIDLEATSNYFGPGHRILLEVSSSSFPRFDRNLNTGGRNYDETRSMPARNRVHHSDRYRSHLLLPVVP